MGPTTWVQRELSDAGLLEKVFGTIDGYGWRLTDAGVGHVRELAEPTQA